MNTVVFVVFFVISVAQSVPLDARKPEPSFGIVPEHNVSKRFINPAMSWDEFKRKDYLKIRTKRNAEECEKLELCALHARSGRSFISTFELYFVNKENARLWDHRAHSLADCYRRYNCDS